MVRFFGVSGILCALLLSGVAFAGAVESSNAFNQFISPEGGVNPLSGTVAFSKPVARISAGKLSATFSLNYSGNVVKATRVKNDEAPTGWVGLGFSLGFSQIVSDHNGSMFLGDDVYWLVTAEGLRSRILYDGGRWWLEGQPYWKLERVTEHVSFDEKEYDIVVGWRLTDDSGLRHSYGDFSYCRSNRDVPCPAPAATQYDLAWPKSYGHVGHATDPGDFPYPRAWALVEDRDLDGNTISYSYSQEWEGLAFGTSRSDSRYTKEIYLKRVVSSSGVSIDFELGEKGTGDFGGEYVDSHGKDETPGSGVEDAFVDPLERKFLSAIRTKAADGKRTGSVEFCYGPISVRPDGKTVAGYVKRLLTSVTFLDGDGNLVDREDYSYNDDAERFAKDMSYPFGTMASMQGSGCGRVEFDYKYVSVRGEGERLYSETLPLSGVVSGNLMDGTPYLVGKSKTDHAIYAYFWRNGGWGARKKIGRFGYSDKGMLYAGDRDFFVYVTNSEEDSYYMYPVVFDGKDWQVGTAIRCSGPRDRVVLGPGYIVKSHVASGGTLKTSIPWTAWGDTYTLDDLEAEEGSFDMGKLRVYTARNHLALFYLGEDYGNNGCLRVFTFDYSANQVSLTNILSRDNLDDDDTYTFGDGILFGTEEGRDLTGQYVRAWHWEGSGWEKRLTKRLNGFKQDISVQASGDRYFAVRHNDQDDMSLFDWDGEKWDIPFLNMNMVHNDDIDMIGEARWDARSGKDFFVARRPYVDNLIELPLSCSFKFSKWKVDYRCFTVPLWSMTYDAARIELFERKDGGWERSGERDFGQRDKEKKVLVGDGWFYEWKTHHGYFRNYGQWNTIEQRINMKDGGYAMGPFIFAEDTTWDETTIYYKMGDSFEGGDGIHVVSEKRTVDPVEDKVVPYGYRYFFGDSPDLAFDYVHNTPLISSYKVDLPENAGVLTKTLCRPDTAEYGLGTGQICHENVSVGGMVEKSVLTHFERHRDSLWPGFIYQDRVDRKESWVKGVHSRVVTAYVDSVNGRPGSVRTFMADRPVSEERTVYAAGIYPSLLDANRLQERAAGYTCIPDCDTGMVATASVARYAVDLPGTTRPAVADEWFLDSSMTIAASPSFPDFSWNSSSQASRWKLSRRISGYVDNRPVEETDRLGIKSSVLYDDRPDGLPRVSVSNAGVGEIFMLPGDSCALSGMSVTSCWQVGLLGDATSGSGTGYGRFAAGAIGVSPDHPLSFTIPSSHGGEYRFSFWVQNVDAVPNVLGISANGVNLHTVSVQGSAAGKWSYVEWLGEIPAGSVPVSLSTGSGNFRLQDVRVVPHDADASVTYYDRYWGGVSAQVDSRGVGSYVARDAQGRIGRVYGEDVDGNLRLLSEREYGSADCREHLAGSDALSSLTVNGIPLFPQSGGESSLVLPGSASELSFSWSPAQKSDRLRYRFRASGAEAEWQTSCCHSVDGFRSALDGNAEWILDVDIEPFESDVYTLRISRAQSDWVDYGGPLFEGKSPSFGNGRDSSVIYYASAAGLVSAAYDGNAWQTTTALPGDAVAVSLTGGGALVLSRSSDYDGGVEDSVGIYSVSGGTWSKLGALAGGGGIYRMFRFGGNPCFLYGAVEGDTVSGLRTGCVTGGNIEPFGGLPQIADTTFSSAPPVLAGHVHGSRVASADVAVGPGGKPFVAYVGSLPALGRDSGLAMPKAVIVKRFFTSAESGIPEIGDIWAGPAHGELPDLLGDVLVVDDTVPLLGVRDVKLAGDADYLYMAVLHGLDSLVGRYALSVFRGHYVDGVDSAGHAVADFVFEPYLDTSVHAALHASDAVAESRIVAYLDGNSAFDFAVRDGVPYVLFSNEENGRNLTLVRHAGGRWLSVGRPAFASAAYAPDAASLALGAEGTPTVVFRESSSSDNVGRRNRIVPLKHVADGAKDITLSALGMSADGASVNDAFRQYILDYELVVPGSVSSVTLSPRLMKKNEVLAVQFERGDSLVSLWNSGNDGSLLSRFLFFLRDLFGFVEDPSATIPLEEGMNTVRIRVVGQDGLSLVYTVRITREKAPRPGLEVVGGDAGVIVLPLSPDTTAVVSLDTGSVREICFQFNYGWTLLWKGVPYFRNVCLPIDLRDTAGTTLLLADTLGDTSVVNVIPGENGPLGPGGGDPGQDSSFIPSPFREIAGYVLFASGNMSLADRDTVYGDVAVSGAEFGTDALHSGSLLVKDDLLLRNRATVGDVTAGGNVTLQDGASYASFRQGTVVLPDIPSVSFLTGSGNVDVYQGDTLRLAPGRYGDVHAFANSTLVLQPGDYYLSSLSVEPDALLKLEPQGNGVRLWVDGNVSFSDRARTESDGNVPGMFLYTNLAGSIQFGVNTAFGLVLVAPHATVNVASHAHVNGHIAAQSLNVQPESVVGVP